MAIAGSGHGYINGGATRSVSECASSGSDSSEPRRGSTFSIGS